MLFFKSCPRCKGDIHFNQDIYGRYKECLQCGFMEDVQTADEALAAAVAKVGFAGPKRGRKPAAAVARVA